jgi:hypothetical protein
MARLLYSGQADGAGRVLRGNVRGHDVRRTGYAGTSVLRVRTYFGWPMSLIFRPARGFSIWPWCLTYSAGASLVERSNTLDTALMWHALDIAFQQRRHEGVILHSDQSCQGGFNRSSQHL